ncbi:complement factor H, partial [Brachionus plicatilis]
SLVDLESLTKVTSTSAYVTQIQNPNSLISYQCLPGYFAQKNKIIQFTKCNLNGTWSSIEDCGLHKCLSKLPKRPLNGRRSVEIFFNLKGLNNQSVVNFSCNDFFEHIGRHQVYCINYEWENDVPTCVLKKNICLNKPPILFENSVLKSLTKIRIKFENDYTNWSNLTHFTEAMYTCLPGYRFEDFHDIKYEYFDKLVPFKKVYCIGPNKWQSIPQCVRFKISSVNAARYNIQSCINCQRLLMICKISAKYTAHERIEI